VLAGEFICETVQNSDQPEARIVGKSIAAVIREEGVIEGALKQQREDLLRALRVKFLCVPAEIEEEIKSTTDVKKLADWLDDVVLGKKFSDIRFSSRYDLSRMTWTGTSEGFDVEDMGKIVAELYEGRLKEQREDLLRYLRLKFKRVPAAIKAEINATRKIEKLDGWIDEVVIAKTLSDMHFSSRS
jgi:hypothetical protein